MPLPGILLPSIVPAFVADSQLVEEESVFANVSNGYGPVRKRRVFTEADRTVDVAFKPLTQAQIAALDAWYEDVLLAGERTFAVQLSNQAAGTRWWEARWLEIKSDPRSGRWLGTGKLRLYGSSYAEAPAAADLAAEFGLSLIGSAAVVTSGALAAEFGLSLEGDAPITAEFGMELAAIVPRRLLIGGGFYLLIDASHRLRIS